MAITILADLDGTLLPRPYTVQDNDSSSNDTASPATPPAVVHPNLSEGPAYGPLVRLLDLGATVVGITGSQLATHRRRFFDDLPLEHRKAGRVLLAVQTGSQLYAPHPADGRPVRDEAFDAHLSRSNQSVRLDDDVVRELVEIGRRGLARFYDDLVTGSATVDKDGPLGYLVPIAAKLRADREAAGTDLAIRVPITDDGHQLPRIEVRQNNSAVVFIGVPSSVGSDYFCVPDHLRPSVDGRPTGRNAFDCVPAGLDKSHVVRYLLRHRTDVMRRGRTVAMGGQPAGNDAGLTLWHTNNGTGQPAADDDDEIPFVSVSERENMVPSRLKDCHVSTVPNAEGSAKVLIKLAEMLEGDATGRTMGDVSLCTHTVKEIVKKVNNAAYVSK